jgi:hypothetical protein
MDMATSWILLFGAAALLLLRELFIRLFGGTRR